MAAEQDVAGIALGLTLDTTGWSSGIARAKAELEGLKRSAQTIEVGVTTRRGGAGPSAISGGPGAIAGTPGAPIGAQPVVSPRFQVSAASVRQLRVDINSQLRQLSAGGEAVAIPVKLGRVPFATMRSEIASGIGEVPIRIKPDAGSLTAFAAVLSAMTGQTPGKARASIESAAASRGIPARRHGGPTTAGRPYLVGEDGPEIHWPNSAGQVIPMRRTGGNVSVGRLTRQQASFYRNVKEAAERLQPHHVEGGRDWYRSAGAYGRAMGEQHGLPPHQAIGALAALSAGTAWSSNKTKFEKILRARSAGEPFPYNMNLDAHRKASAILNGSLHPDKAFATSPKVGQFYKGLMGDLSTLTIDLWATRTASRGGLDQPGRGTARKKIEDAYRRVAQAHGLENAEMQAALWLLEKEEAGRPDRAKGGGVRAFCSTCGTNIRDPRTHPSTAKHQANARGSSGSSRWLSGRPGWAFGYRNQDSQYDPPGHETELGPDGKPAWWGRAKGGPAYKPVEAATFHRRIAMASMKYSGGRRIGETVHVYSPEEYAEMRTYLDATGQSGYAVKPDGDLVSVFNAGERGVGTGKKIMRSAIQRGASKLDAFDEEGFLPGLYKKFGFREVGRDPWDPQYAPEGWRGGKPDVVYMERQRAAIKRAMGRAFGGRVSGASNSLSASTPLMRRMAELGIGEGGPTPTAPLVLRTSGSAEAEMRRRATWSQDQQWPEGATATARDERSSHNVDPITKRLPKGVKIRFSRQFTDYPDPADFIGTGGAGYHGPDWHDRWKDPGQLTMGYFQPQVRGMSAITDTLRGVQQSGPMFDPMGESVPTARKWGSLGEYLRKGSWGQDVNGMGRGERAKLVAYALDQKNRVLGHALMSATKNIPHYGPDAGKSIDTLHPDYVWTSPEARGMGLASAMYSRAEKLTGMMTSPSSSQTPFGKRLWSKPPSERSFGRGFRGRTLDHEAEVEIDTRDAMRAAGMPHPIDAHGWRNGAASLGPDPYRDFSNAVDPVTRVRPKSGRVRGQLKLPGFAKGGWSTKDFFQQAGSSSLGMWKGRMMSPEDVMAWETQLRETSRGPRFPTGGGGLSPVDPRWLPKKAVGGALADMGRYIIGEIGRELFVPKRMEGVIPADVAAQLPQSQGLLARLLTGRARAAGGGVKDIGGRGSEPWTPSEDGWVIPNRLMHRIPRHSGGPAHPHPHLSASGKTYINEQGRRIPDAQVGNARIMDNERLVAGMTNVNTAGGSGRFRPPTPPVPREVYEARRTISQTDPILQELTGYESRAPLDIEAARERARARVYSGATRGLTGRAALGGLFGFVGGGRGRREGAIEADLTSRQLGNLLPKGVSGVDPGTFFGEQMEKAQGALKGSTTQLEALAKAGVTSGNEVEYLNQQVKTAGALSDDYAKKLGVVGDLERKNAAALLKSQGGAGSNLLSVTAAGVAFNAGMQAVQIGIEATTKVMSPIIDQFAGFTAIGQQVSKSLADALPAAGTLPTLIAQRGAAAGFSASGLGFLERELGGGVYAKAGGTAAEGAGDLIRASISTAPTGLIGGYGGLFGGGLGAELMGGGKGLLESISGTYAATRGSPTSAGIGGDFEAGIGAIGRVPGAILGNLTTPDKIRSDIFNPLVAVSSDMQEASSEWLQYVNEATGRGRRAQGLTGGGATLGEATALEQAQVLAIPGLDDYTRQLAEEGAVFRDASGNLLKSQLDISKAVGDIARGLSIPDEGTFAATQAQGLRAQRAAAGERGRLERETLIPGQLGQQVLANPFMSATAGLAEGFEPTIANLTTIQTMQNDITRDARAGVEAQAKLVDTQLGVGQGNQFRQYMSGVEGYGQQITSINEQLADKQAQLGMAQYAFQLRVISRNIRDAKGLAGQAGGSRLGGLQRDQWELGRESQRLQLESQRLANEMAQRQINFQVAIAGFQAPGITGQERAARMEEASVEASFAQRQLDIQKQQTGIAGAQYGNEGQIFRIQTEIAVQDLEVQRGLLMQQHQVEQEQIAAQKQISALTMRQSQLQAKAQSLFAEATGNFDARLGAASQYVAQFGGTMAAAIIAVRRAMGALGDTGARRPPGGNAKGDTRGANGLLGFTGGETGLVVGEVAGEAVAILKNPKMGTLAGPSGGGGGNSITVMITGNNINDQIDLQQITREVTSAVEEALSRKAGMLNVSAG